MAGARIDLHAHDFPVEVWALLSELYPETFQLDAVANAPALIGYMGSKMPVWDAQSRIAEMDQAGVSMEVLSLPFIYATLDEHAPEICRRVNDAYAGMQTLAPKRFRGFAHLPFNNVDAALRELSRCIDELDFGGVAITSNIGGRYLDEADFEPFWKEVNRRRVPVFMHPIESPCYKDVFRSAILSFPFDTTLAIARLVCSGLYERYPDIVLIAAHQGGALPFLSYRLDAGLSQAHAHGWSIKAPPSTYLKKLYLDTATVWDEAAFRCAHDLVGSEQMVFGSDSFAAGPQFRKKMVDFLERAELSSEQREKIYHHNIERVWREMRS